MSSMLHGCLQDTTYREVTAANGRTYGVWVTMPPGYSEDSGPLPLLYVLDGNWTVGLTAPLAVVQGDPFLSISPYIQVTIGYGEAQAEDWAQIRNHDLVPPGEPVSEEMLATLNGALESGVMTQGQVDAYLEQLTDTRADLFLDFIVGELHPLLAAELPVAETGHSLFGYSYGGLFALYAWLRGATLFSSIGAGTPGVSSAGSPIFELIADLPEPAGDGSDPRLHVTVNEAELLGDVPIYRQIARHILDALEGLHAKGYGELISRETMHDTHVTGLQSSFLSYLKACHSR